MKELPLPPQNIWMWPTKASHLGIIEEGEMGGIFVE
jgi:hypothetical protein